MSALQAEVYEAFRTLDVPDEKALRAAVPLTAALAKVEDDTAKGFNKRDADVEAIRRDIAAINDDLAGINVRLAVMQGAAKSDMTVLRSDLNGRMTTLEGTLNARMAAMQGEINLLKWMMGTMIALLVTVLFRVFIH